MSPLGQSMAALFSPENQKLREAQKQSRESRTLSAQGLVTPNTPVGKLEEGGKSQDSLGNPSSPGYESVWGRKKESATTPEVEQSFQVPGPAIEVPLEAQNKVIRLQVGWEKLLLAQKKICEKAKNLLTQLEAPVRYAKERRAKSIQLKSRGCIVDLDMEAYRQEQEHQAKIKKDEEAA